MFDSTEADDVIAYVAQHKQLEEYEKIILSSDKDFFQLLDDKTVLYRPIQKEVLNKKSIIEKFEIHPTNFAWREPWLVINQTILMGSQD